MNDVPKVMKAIQLTGHGGLEKLVFRDDIPAPTPGPCDVLIKASAAGVNNTNLGTRLGWHSKSNGDSSDASWLGNAIQFPKIHGADVCGGVVAAGEQVDASLPNKRVLVEPCILEAGGKVLDQHCTSAPKATVVSLNTPSLQLGMLIKSTASSATLNSHPSPAPIPQLKTF